MRAKLGVAAGAAVVVAAIVAVLVGGDPKPAAPAPRAPAPAAPAPAPPRAPAPGPLVPPAATPRTPAPRVAPVNPGATRGEALVLRVRDIVARGEGAQAPADEAAAAGDLERALADVVALGDAALPEALRLLEPGLPRGVQEVGARLLGLVGSLPALERLADLARDAKAAAEVRLQALRGLRSSALPFARGAISDVAQDRAVDPGVRGFALHLLRDVEGAAAILVDVTLDAEDEPRVRAAALEALFELEPARARGALAEVGADPKLSPILDELGLRSR